MEEPLRRADPASVGVDPEVLDGPLLDLLAGTRTRAAALLVRGRLVWERYLDGCHEGTRFAAWSVTKAFTAAAIGLLVGDGVLALDDHAARFLHEWSGDARRAITVRHLLTMTSGLALHPDRWDDAEDATVAALSWPLLHRPGSVWCYEQATAHALVPIITRASGKQPSDLIRERLPIGIGALDWDRTPSGDCLGHSGLNLTARDLCRFGELLVGRGRHGGRALLDARFVARMLRVDAVTRAARAEPPRDDFRRRAYGFLVYLNEDRLWSGVPEEAFALLGAWGNMCLVDPSRDFVFVRLVTPQGREADAALDGNALSAAGHGTARVFRLLQRAFDPAPTWAKSASRRFVEARLDAQDTALDWARRRGLSG
jgi:CubicO group peptidase (beta-lactamase class C family)